VIGTIGPERAGITANKIVQVENLVKVYKGGVRAVDGIDVAVDAGEFFGFLGPNGAGKTTTMKILSTLLRKTSGKVIVAGHDMDDDPGAVRKSIGFAMQEVGLDDLATGRDFLRLQGILYGLSPKDANGRTDELLELVGLTSVASRKVATYSGGMRRRVDLAGALMHDPQLLFLDEPTTGLDPQSRLAIWDHLRELNSRGVTVFMTTQMMEEADRLCKRVAIVDKGTIVAEGSPMSLKTEIGGDVVQISVASPDSELQNGLAQKSLDLLKDRPYVTSATATDGVVNLTTPDGGPVIPDIVNIMGQSDIAIANLSVSRPTLDDVFLKHTGRSIRDEEASGGDGDSAARQMLGLSDRR
jgi:ABC-2 type transport system ATP-binding protein